MVVSSKKFDWDEICCKIIFIINQYDDFYLLNNTTFKIVSWTEQLNLSEDERDEVANEKMIVTAFEMMKFNTFVVFFL